MINISFQKRIKSFIAPLSLTLMCILILSACRNEDNNKVDNRVDNSLIISDLEKLEDEAQDFYYLKFVDLDTDDIEKEYDIRSNRSYIGEYAFLYSGGIEYYNKKDELIRKTNVENEILVYDLRNIRWYKTGLLSYKYYLIYNGMLVYNGGLHNISNRIYCIDKYSKKSVIQVSDSSKYVVVNLDGRKYLFQGNGVLNRYARNVEGRWSDELGFYSKYFYTDENGLICDEPGIHKVLDYYFFIKPNGSPLEQEYVIYDGKVYLYNEKQSCYYLSIDTLEDFRNKHLGGSGNDSDYINVINEYYNNHEKPDHNFHEKLITDFDTIKNNEFTRVEYERDKYAVVYWNKKSEIAFLKEDNNFAYNEILEVDGEKYLFKNNFLLLNDIYELNGHMYLTDEKGRIISKAGINKFSNIREDVFYTDEPVDGDVEDIVYNKNFYSYCFIDEDGFVVHDVFFKYENNYYYADKHGRLLCNESLYDILYFGEDGKLEDYNIDISDIDYVNKIIIVYDINEDVTNPTKYKYNMQPNIDSKLYQDAKRNEFYDGVDFKIYDKNNKQIFNRFVGDYYIGEDGWAIRNKVFEVNGKKYIADMDGKIVKSTWLFDKKYYNNSLQNSNTNKYINGYRLDREVIKPYLGKYVLGTGEIIMDNINIAVNIYTIAIEEYDMGSYVVKNGEYDGFADSNIERLGRCNTENAYGDDDDEVWTEYDEGHFDWISPTYRDKEYEKHEIEKGNLYHMVRGNPYHVEFGEYFQSDISGNIKDKLSWRVLIEDDNEALLLCNNAIDRKIFDDNSNSWEDSKLRKWLNEEFYNIAFDKREQKKIVQKDIVTTIASASTITKDKIFIISSDEYQNFENVEEWPEYRYFYETRFCQSKWDGVIHDNAYGNVWCRDGKIRVALDMETKDGVLNRESAVRPAIWVRY